jgi:hypothetical protein
MNALALWMQKFDRVRLSDFLLTTTYDQERMLYYNDRDKTCGFIVEVDPVVSVGSQTTDGLTGFFSTKWPKDSLVQITLFGDPNLDEIFNGYCLLRGRREEIVGDEIRELLFDWANDNALYLDSKSLTGIDPDMAPCPFQKFQGIR